jgi:hypothetical protein
MNLLRHRTLHPTEKQGKAATDVRMAH